MTRQQILKELKREYRLSRERLFRIEYSLTASRRMIEDARLICITEERIIRWIKELLQQ